MQGELATVRVRTMAIARMSQHRGPKITRREHF